MGTQRRILLVEDEDSLAIPLQDRLVQQGYEVLRARDGGEALDVANRETLHVIILDIMLPVKDGFEVCRELRQKEIQIPILMLTARSDVVDKVVGLKLGADDYLTKPFEMMELLARVETLLRRARIPVSAASGSYTFGHIEVNFRSAQVHSQGQPVELSALEYRLLCYFIEHRGTTLSRDQLLNQVWGYEAMPYTRTVDAHVASLRQKIESQPKRPQFLMTVHGMGYRFVG